MSLAAHGQEADHLRKRAEHCRALSKAAKTELMRNQLAELAGELEAKADKIDAEHGQKPEADVE